MYKIRAKIKVLFNIKDEDIDQWLRVPLLVLDNRSCQYWIDKGREDIVLNLLNEMDSGISY